MSYYLKRLCFFSIFFFLFCSHVFASDPIIETTVSPNTLFIGDIFTYSIELKLDKNISLIKVPDKTMFLGNKALSFITDRVSKSTDSEFRYIRLDYDLQIFDLNQQLIPTQQITLKESNAYQTITIPAQRFTVNAIKPADVMDIQLSNHIFINTNLNWVSILLSLFLATLLSIGLFQLYRLFKTKAKPNIDKPIIQDNRSPFEIANDDLSTNFNQLNSIQIKDYYVNYSDIIKTYLSTILTIDNIEMTSFEILSLCHNRFNEQDYRRIKKLLNFSDSVKFAQFPANDDDNHLYYQKAIECLQLIHEGQHANTTTTSPASTTVMEELTE
tara:strand:+ start:14440 stop:15423 length:984 start_codon:yes stop_codon:yes gene_type:complete